VFDNLVAPFYVVDTYLTFTMDDYRESESTLEDSSEDYDSSEDAHSPEVDTLASLMEMMCNHSDNVFLDAMTQLMSAFESVELTTRERLDLHARLAAFIDQTRDRLRRLERAGIPRPDEQSLMVIDDKPPPPSVLWSPWNISRSLIALPFRALSAMRSPWSGNAETTLPPARTDVGKTGRMNFPSNEVEDSSRSPQAVADDSDGRGGPFEHVGKPALESLARCLPQLGFESTGKAKTRTEKCAVKRRKARQHVPRSGEMSSADVTSSHAPPSGDVLRADAVGSHAPQSAPLMSDSTAHKTVRRKAGSCTAQGGGSRKRSRSADAVVVRRSPRGLGPQGNESSEKLTRRVVEGPVLLVTPLVVNNSHGEPPERVEMAEVSSSTPQSMEATPSAPMEAMSSMGLDATQGGAGVWTTQTTGPITFSVTAPPQEV
jgi:hypothetical protein